MFNHPFLIGLGIIVAFIVMMTLISNRQSHVVSHSVGPREPDPEETEEEAKPLELSGLQTALKSSAYFMVLENSGDVEAFSLLAITAIHFDDSDDSLYVEAGDNTYELSAKDAALLQYKIAQLPPTLHI